MHYKIETARDHVRVDVFGRETAEETREFLKAASAKVVESGLPRMLVCGAAGAAAGREGARLPR